MSVLDSAIHFAFRCHQFAGGFDEEAASLFDRLHQKHDELRALEAACLLDGSELPHATPLSGSQV